jgi:hypothetical protein
MSYPTPGPSGVGDQTAPSGQPVLSWLVADFVLETIRQTPGKLTPHGILVLAAELSMALVAVAPDLVHATLAQRSAVLAQEDINLRELAVSLASTARHELGLEVRRGH